MCISICLVGLNLSCFALFFFLCDVFETRSWELSCGLRAKDEANGVVVKVLEVEGNLAKMGE